MADDPLFQPLRLGNLILPNRVVMTTVKLGYGNQQGEVTDRHVAFYTRRAQAKIALLTTEPMYVQLNGRELPTQLGIHDNRLIAGLRRLTDAVHANGGRMMAHINHAGRVANPKLVPAEERISASDILCPTNQVKPNPLTRSSINEVVAAFGAAARRVRQAGFDAIEIPFSHGYLIHQFLSPLTNRRSDEYGGTLENRLRFGLDVLEAVRCEVGDSLPIIVRMNAMDYVEGGLNDQDAIDIAGALDQVAIDALSVTSGTMCESVPYSLYPTGTPKSNLLPMAARIRAASKLPVIVAGRIRTPAVAREALAAGQTDLIGLARPFLADPEWAQKAKSGDEEAILLCAACHQGCLAQLRKGAGTGCSFNPFTGRETGVKLFPITRPRQVMVVGGGPAGLEAATVAARRGHHVSLYEQEDHLGGQFNLAARAPHKEDFLDVIRYLVLMAERAGVEIFLNTQVTPETVTLSQPDVVILATGGIPLTIPFPGLDDTQWLQASDLLDGGHEINTATAFVIGGGLVGLETADYLAARGVVVTLVEMLDQVGADIDQLAKAMLLKRLNAHGVKIHTGTKVVGLTKNAALVQQDEEVVSLPIETVVVAVGVRANRTLPDALAGSDRELHIIGDAAEPRRALEAIREGFEAGNKV
ncbi:MAG: FAD-dependent oxidoreductase [Chloroflexota bacterium]|jgi:2,4-dienoyl-CoA reductase-like NADH-dependent reductase (Old Yellow Enzyme family)/thioredoxin reductase